MDVWAVCAGWGCVVTGVLIYAALLVPAVLVVLSVAVWRLWHRQRRVDAFMQVTAECVERLINVVAFLAADKALKEVGDEQDR